MDRPKKTTTAEQAFMQMTRLCSMKECCVWDIQQKLKRMYISEGDAEQIVIRLKKGRYVDEARYARNYIHDKLSFDKWGKIKIALSLRQKKIPDEVIVSAFAEFNDNEFNASLQPLLEAKRKTIHGSTPYEMNGKLIRYALGRGYPMKEILSCLRKMDLDELPDETE